MQEYKPMLAKMLVLMYNGFMVWNLKPVSQNWAYNEFWVV